MSDSSLGYHCLFRNLPTSVIARSDPDRRSGEWRSNPFIGYSDLFFLLMMRLLRRTSSQWRNTRKLVVLFSHTDLMIILLMIISQRMAFAFYGISPRASLIIPQSRHERHCEVPCPDNYRGPGAEAIPSLVTQIYFSFLWWDCFVPRNDANPDDCTSNDDFPKCVIARSEVRVTWQSLH